MSKVWEKLGKPMSELRVLRSKARERTILVREKRPEAIIIIPDDNSYEPLGRKIRNKIREISTVELPIKNDENFTEEDKKKNIIALGNISNNRVLIPLYHLRLVAADRSYPGKGGYAVRTVVNPWGNSKNVISLSGSDIDGVKEAVKVFLGELKVKQRDVFVEYLLKIRLGEDFKSRFKQLEFDPDEKFIEEQVKIGRQSIEEGMHRRITPNLSHAGFMYLLTGREEYAKLYLRLFKVMYESAVNDTGEGPWSPWGFDADFQSYSMITAWDSVEHSPIFTEIDKKYILNHLIDYLKNNIKHAKGHAPKNPEAPRHNHYTFAALGLLYGAKYFKRNFDLPDAEEWLKIADECFSIQTKLIKPDEDCNAYQWLTLYHTLLYSLVRPDPTFLENGNATKCLETCIKTMNNLGYQVPYGDVSHYNGTFSEVPFIKTVAWWTQDAVYKSIISLKETKRNPYDIRDIYPPCFEYETDLKEKKSSLERFCGVSVIPLEKKYYEERSAWPRLYEELGITKHEIIIPYEKTFDKISFRTNFKEESDYLLIDGISNGGHRHFDGNAIIQLTSCGRIWLADSDYMKSPTKFHNSVLVFKNGFSSLIPSYARLDHVSDMKNMGISVSSMLNYSGVNWRRSVLWVKEKYFIVADRLKALEDADYDFRCIWRSIGDVLFDERSQTMTIRQGSEIFHIKPANCLKAKLDLRLISEPFRWANWNEYQYGSEDVKVFEENIHATMKKGNIITYINLLHSESKSPDLKIERVSENAVRIKDGKNVAIVGFNGSDLNCNDIFETDALCYFIEDEKITFFGMKKARLEDLKITAEDLVDVELSVREGLTGVIVPTVRTKIEIRHGEKILWENNNLSSEINIEKKDNMGVQVALSIYRAMKKLLEDIEDPPDLEYQKESPTDILKPIQLKPIWLLKLKEKITCATLSVPNHATPEEILIVGSESGRVYAVEEGSIKWIFETSGRINCLDADDILGNGRDEIIIASDDHHVYLIDSVGKLVWKRELPFYMHEPTVEVVFSADFGLDRGKCVVAGGANSHFFAYNPNGEELWRYEVIHNSTTGMAVDLNGDGVDEVVAGTIWWPWHCLDKNGKRVWGARVRGRWGTGPILGPGANCVEAISNERGEKEVAFGSVDGNILFFDKNGVRRKNLYVGEEILCLSRMSLKRNHEIVLAGSGNGYIYAVGSSAKVIWKQFLGGKVTAIEKLNEAIILAGTDRGDVFLLETNGVIKSRIHMDSSIVTIISSNGGNSFLIVTQDGKLAEIDAHNL